MFARQLSKRLGLTDEEGSLIDSTDDLNRLAATLDEFVLADTKRQVFDKLKP